MSDQKPADEFRHTWSRRFDELLSKADLLDEDDHLAVLGVHEALLAEQFLNTRAEVERLRTERDSMVRDLLQAVYPGDPMPDRPLDTVWNHLIEKVRVDSTDVDRWRALRLEPLALEIGSPDEAYVQRIRERLTDWFNVRAGARPIPDDAEAQIAQCLADYWIDLRGGRVPFEETDAGQAEEVLKLVRSWLSTPTTGPAPAAVGYLIAGPSDEDARAGRTSDPADLDPGAWDGVVHATVEDGRRSLASCHAHGYIEGWRLYALTEVVPPAAPQAPAEPTAHVMLCPTCGTYTAGVSGEACVNDGTVLRPAAREDTAPPDDYGDNLGGWRHVPVSPSRAHAHVEVPDEAR